MGLRTTPPITRVRPIMARLPTPVPPPVRHVDRAILDGLDDEESLAKTTERRAPRITTARFSSISPIAIDIAAPTAPASASASASAPAPWSALPVALLQHPRAALAAAVWLACVLAGITGVLVGHARPARAHATSNVATHAASAPRTAVVIEANEEVTQLPILAPGKESDSDGDAVSRTTKSASPPVQRRSGFGHLGADRVASGAAARRGVPHRR